MMLVKAIVIAVLACILLPPLRTYLWYMDWYSYSHKHHPGRCRHVKAYGAGYEDFHILSSGLTFISSGVIVTILSPEFKSYAKSKGNGSIQMMDLSLGSSETEVLPIKHGNDFDPGTFRPCGIDVIEDKVKGEHLIYTVSHVENEADRVDKFRYLPKTRELQHEKSIFSDQFHILNDLIMLAEDKFYATNYWYFNTSYTMAFLENLYMWKLGGVLYYDGSRVTRTVDGLFTPNGVSLSKDKRYLYVALFIEKIVQVYKIQPDNGLKLVQEVDVHTGADNFHLSEDGESFFVGSHPVIHKLAAHLENPTIGKTPSQVIRMPLKDGLIQAQEISQEFYDQGDLISGSSVAGVYKDKMLIGSVMDSLVVCQLPTAP